MKSCETAWLVGHRAQSLGTGHSGATHLGTLCISPYQASFSCAGNEKKESSSPHVVNEMNMF